MNEETAQFARITIPLVRRIYPALLANELMPVQPLQDSVGLEYLLNFFVVKHDYGKVNWQKEGF